LIELWLKIQVINKWNKKCYECCCWEHIGNMVGMWWEPKKSNTPTIPQKNENSSPLTHVTSPLWLQECFLHTCVLFHFWPTWITRAKLKMHIIIKQKIHILNQSWFFELAVYSTSHQAPPIWGGLAWSPLDHETLFRPHLFEVAWHEVIRPWNIIHKLPLRILGQVFIHLHFLGPKVNLYF